MATSGGTSCQTAMSLARETAVWAVGTQFSDEAGRGPSRFRLGPRCLLTLAAVAALIVFGLTIPDLLSFENIPQVLRQVSVQGELTAEFSGDTASESQLIEAVMRPAISASKKAKAVA